MKVLFVVPYQRTLLSTETNIVGDPHLGIGYLSSMLRKQGIAVKALDMRFGYSMLELLKTIEEFDPDIVGVTMYSFGYKSAYQIVDVIKSHTDKLVVVGGPHVSVVRSEVLKETKADFAVKHEGEHTMLELCREIEEGNNNFEEILGLIWRKENEIIENNDRPWIQNLDTLPFPTFEEVEHSKYQSFHIKGVVISSSRGCPYGCNFCSVRLCMGRNFRIKSSENVLKEIEHWYLKGFNKFFLVDDCFTLYKDRVEAICDGIVSKKMKIKWNLFNGIRVDSVNLRLLKKMRKAGCTYVAFGVEAGNDETLKRIGKQITKNQVREAVKLAKEAGLISGLFFIIGHPGETYEKAMETIKFAEELVNLGASYVNFFNLIPYPGSELFEWVKENATFIVPPEEYLNSTSLKDADPVFETKEFSAKERKLAIKKGFALYRKTALQLKLGSVAGFMAYLLTSHPLIEKIFWRAALGTKLGHGVTVFLQNLVHKRVLKPSAI